MAPDGFGQNFGALFGKKRRRIHLLHRATNNVDHETRPYLLRLFFLIDAVQSPVDQMARIEQVLGPEGSLGPLRFRFKLDAQKIADLAKHTVFHAAFERSARVMNAKRAAQRHGLFHLQAGSGKGDVLQIRHTSADSAGLILPLDVDEVRAQ